MNVIFTCGGTGGHIFPAIAVAKLLRERRPDCNILFMGAEDGMETTLVPREGFELETVRISNFQRGLSKDALEHNVEMFRNMKDAMKKAKQVIRSFKPDVIVGTGGYASFPALAEGAKLGVKTVVHESNAVPGLTTRMVERTADVIMVGFEESRQYYHHPERVRVTGMPVRDEFIYADRQKAREKMGLDERPLVVSYWGSLGAREMNKIIACFMKLECDDGEPFSHIHATGSFGWKWMPEFVKEQGVDLSQHPSVDMRVFIYDMPDVMAAADLVICRAGAATISEICASATPCIMVPSPNVTDNHQEKNARVMERGGAAVVLREAECSGEVLYQTAKELLCDKERLSAMRKAAAAMAPVDAAERIYETVLEMAKA